MKYTKQQILEMNPCGKALTFCEKCKFDSVKMWNICERGDWMIWALRRTAKLTKPMAVEIAIECALHVIAIYEKKHPKDKRPREAIKAAQAWLKNPTDKNKRAAAAVDAVDAVDAAADAADAAVDAVDAVDARLKERKWQSDKIREIVPCPFE